MEIEIIRKEKNELEFVIVECDEAVGELLVSRLNDEKEVENAAYKKVHPFDKGITVYLHMKSGDPKVKVAKILEKIEKEIEGFKGEAKKKL